MNRYRCSIYSIYGWCIPIYLAVPRTLIAESYILIANLCLPQRIRGIPPFRSIPVPLFTTPAPALVPLSAPQLTVPGFNR